MATLPAHTQDYSIKSFKWSDFSQRGFGNGSRVTGQEIAAILHDVAIELGATDSSYQVFKIFKIGSLGTCGDVVENYGIDVEEIYNIALTNVWDFMSRDATYTTFIDKRDNQEYRALTIKIGTYNQTWMAQNLNLDADGSYCYDNSGKNCDKYGRLYTWAAAMDSAAAYTNTGKGCGMGVACDKMGNVVGVCPEGWHLPSLEEWNSLVTYVGAGSPTSSQFKTKIGWNKGFGGSDDYGFSAVPGGYMTSDFVSGDAGEMAAFWSTDEADDEVAKAMTLDYDTEPHLNNQFYKNYALSVRCVKTEPIATDIAEEDLIWYGGSKLADTAATTYLKDARLKDYIWTNVDTLVTFGANPAGDMVTDALLSSCGGGVCGKVGIIPEDGTDPTFGFDVNPDSSLEDWGGVCLTYTASMDSIIMYLGTGGGVYSAYSESIGWSFYHVNLPAAATPTKVCYPWTHFRQYNWGKPVRIQEFLTHVRDLSFRFGSNVSGATFNIIAIGSYKAGKSSIESEGCGSDDLWCKNAIGYRVITDMDAGTGSSGKWYVFSDNDLGGLSSVDWPVELAADGSFDPVIDHCKGLCGTAHLSWEGVSSTPFVGVGFNIAGFTAGSSEPVPANVSDWGGVCITYTASVAPTLEFNLGDDTNVALDVDLPMVRVPKKTNPGEECVAWSDFKQAGWGKKDKIEGSEAAKIAVGLNIKIQAVDGTTADFNVIRLRKFPDAVPLGTCEPSDSVANLGATVEWKFIPNSETALYSQDDFDNGSYSWTMPDGVTGTGSGVTVNETYSAPGKYSASVSATVAGKTQTIYCSEVRVRSADDYLNPDITYGEMTDNRDGQTYKTIKIGDRTWMAQNLNYADSVTTPALEGGNWCTENDASNCAVYGRLYNWAAASAACPENWHLANMSDYNNLTAVAGKNSGVTLRSLKGWVYGGGKDSLGFALVPAGIFYSDESHFSTNGYTAYFWLSTEINQDTAAIAVLGNTMIYAQDSKFPKSYGIPVRCVEGAPITKADDFLKSGFAYDEMTDERDGQTYKTVTIGGQTWMAQNLNYSDAVTTPELEGNISCFRDLSSNCDLYGQLYTNSAAQEACPEGWHLPSSAEFDALIAYVGTSSSAKLRTEKIVWDSVAGTDEFGFSAVPSGRYWTDIDAPGYHRGDAYFWTSDTDFVAYFIADNIEEMGSDPQKSENRFSVRCVKTEPIPAGIRDEDLVWYGGRVLGKQDAFVTTNELGHYVNVQNSSKFEFGATVAGDNTIGDNVVKACGGGICGKILSTEDGPRFGFNVDTSKTNPEEWGGICVTYSMDVDTIQLWIDSDAPSYIGNCVAKLPASKDVTSQCVRWQDFWCSTAKIDMHLRYLSGVNFVFSEGSAGAKFNVVAVGTNTAKANDYMTFIENKANRTSAWDYMKSYGIKYDSLIDDRGSRREIYRTISIGNQTWMAENLNYATATGSSCYNNNSLNCNVYGKLYTWEAAMSACPDGWVLPSKADFDSLISYVGGADDAAAALKSTKGWDSNGSGDDTYGFSALPAGYIFEAQFYSNGQVTNFWSSTEKNSDTVFQMNFVSYSNYSFLEGSYKEHANSVRCISRLGSFTDGRDGQTYKTVKIGDQVWMAENLNYAYLGGTEDLTDSSSFCYDNDPAKCEIYGRLYIWSAAVDSAGWISGNTANNCGLGKDCSVPQKHRGVCPEGWHLPDSTEWRALVNEVGGEEVAALKLKSTYGWDSEGNGTDSFGFSVLSGGDMVLMPPPDDSYVFTRESIDVGFWGSDNVHNFFEAYVIWFYYHKSNVDIPSAYGTRKENGNYVRCVKD